MAKRISGAIMTILAGTLVAMSGIIKSSVTHNDIVASIFSALIAIVGLAMAYSGARWLDKVLGRE